MKISIIAAMDEKRGIGKDNKIPWHIKEDLVHLKNLTKDQVVVLGRKTYESMSSYYQKSGRPMPGRLYIVVTHDKNYKADNEKVVIANSLSSAVEKTRLRQGFGGQGEIFIIGGGQIFKEAIDEGIVDRLYLTIVKGDFNCDTFFPDYSGYDKKISEEEGREENYQFNFIDLER